MEEILYVYPAPLSSGLERDKRLLRPGDSVICRPGLSMPLQCRCRGSGVSRRLAPAKSAGPVTVEVGDKEPWKSLRA